MVDNSTPQDPPTPSTPAVPAAAAATPPDPTPGTEEAALPANAAGPQRNEAKAAPERAEAPGSGSRVGPRLADVSNVRFRLDNGRQNEAYSSEVISTRDKLRVAVRDATLPEGLGLRFVPEGGRIEGIPVRNGEFEFPISYRYGSDAPDYQRSGVCELYVNPDPKLLWENKPSDRTDPLWKEDEARQRISGPERSIIAARQRGRSHAHVGSCCDDDFQISVDDGWYIAVVADGAGSASASRRGSHVAVRAAGNELRVLLAKPSGTDTPTRGEQLIEAARSYMVDPGERTRAFLHQQLFLTVGHSAHAAMKAIRDEVPRWPDLVASEKDLATTLLVGLARPIDGKWLCAAYWVGDGAVGVLRAGAGVDLLGEVDAGEYSGQTRFLDASEVSQEALLTRTRFAIVDDFTAFVLMSDGVSDPKFETEARLSELPAWDAFWSELDSACGLSAGEPDADERLLRWLDFWSQGNHDDRTLAIIY